MEDKAAIEILKRLLDKPGLGPEEKAAVASAIGALSWFALGKNRVQKMIQKKKAQKEKERTLTDPLRRFV